MAEQAGRWTKRTVPPVALVLALTAALGIGIGTPLWLGNTSDRRANDSRPVALQMQVRVLPSYYSSKMTTATMSSTGLIAVGTLAGEVVMLDVRRNAIPLGRFRVGRAAVSLLAFSADGSTLAIATRDGGISAWSWKPGEIQTRRWRPQVDYDVTAIGLSPDGRLLAAATSEIALYDTRTGGRVTTLKGPKRPPGSAETGNYWAIGFSVDSTTLLGGSEAGVDIWTVPKGTVLRSLPFLCDDFGLTATARFLTCGSGGHVILMDLANYQIVGDQTVSPTAAVSGTCATADGRYVYASTTAGELVAWDRSTDTVVARTKLPAKSTTDGSTYAQLSLTHDASALLAMDSSSDPNNLWLVRLS
jgi:WD40 repeat protein